MSALVFKYEQKDYFWPQKNIDTRIKTLAKCVEL